MPTGNVFFIPTDKRLSSFEDIGARGFGYLRELCRQTNIFQFRQGSFREKVNISSPGANQVRITAKTILGDGYVHDGDGHIIDCIYESNTSLFQNTAAVSYEIGVGFVAKPSGMQINPRNGLPEYESWIETIGDEADPVSVTNNGTTITFNVNSVDDDSGMSLAGRTVRVFKKIPAASATTDGVAIEECTVSYGGGVNTITTTGLLGQADVSTSAADYTLQLVGLSIRPATAPSPISVSDHHFFAGTVLGNGGTPTVFSTTNQEVIQSDAAVDVAFSPFTGPAPISWDIAATTTQDAIEEIVSDLSDTSGAAKVGTTALAAWADGDTNPDSNVQAALERVVNDLTSTSGARGLGKLTAPALATWADGTTNPADTAADSLAKIVEDLTSTSGDRGAGKLTAPARGNWADGDTNPAATLAAALAKVITDLTTVSGACGSGKISSPQLDGFKYSLPQTSVATQIEYLLDFLNETFQDIAQSKLVDVGSRVTVGASNMNRIIANDGLLVAVGENGLIRISDNWGITWSTSTPASAYAGFFYDVIYSGTQYVATGSGTLQVSADGVTWTEQSTQAGVWGTIAQAFSTGALICVLTTGVVMTSTNFGTTWSNASPINGGTWSSTNGFGGTAAKGDTIVTIGRPVQINPPVLAKSAYYSTDDGVSWTAIDMTAQFSATEYFGQIVVSPDGQYFVATVEDAGVTTQIMYSEDGITWVQGTTFVGSIRYVLTERSDSVMAALPLTGKRKGKLSKDGITWTAHQFKYDYSPVAVRMLESNNAKMWFFGGVTNPYIPVWAES